MLYEAAHDTASNRILVETKRQRGRIRSKLGLPVTCGGLVMVDERDSRGGVVHGYFSEGGDSILSAFFWEPLRAKLQDN